MATLQINSISIGCTFPEGTGVLVEYKLDSDPSYINVGVHTIDVSGNFTPAVQISGLDVSSCYDIRLTPDISGICAPLVVQSCTEPFFEWIADDTACETEGGFGVVKTITGLASPFRSWYDVDTDRLYVMDIDAPTSNIYWFDDISTATTEADATYSSVAVFDPVLNAYFDATFRRIYLVGNDTGGLVVYDVDANTSSIVAFGTDGPFQRTTLFVSGNLILCNDGNTNVVLINRTTLTVTSTVDTSTLTNPEHFNSGPYIVTMATSNGNLYVVANNSDSPAVGVYDTSLNHITEIALPGVAAWSFANYWLNIFYDETSDKIYVGDSGSNQRYVIDPDTNTVVDTRQNLNLSGKTNSTYTFSVDPLSNNLYLRFTAQNSSSDGSPVSRLYLIDRTTYDFLNMYEGFNAINLSGIAPLGWFVGANQGTLNFAGGPSYDTDGSLTVFSNTVGSDNTGNVIVLTLQEVTDPGGVPTGNTKANSIGDPDYIAPFMDTGECPIVSDLACPAEDVTTFSSGTLYYEFTIPNTVKLNPAVDNIAIYAYNTALLSRDGSPTVIADPTLTNFYDGQFAGLGGVSYTAEVVYRDNLNAELASCILA
jgi:hypothetical protein